jgi:hypothetical protein
VAQGLSQARPVPQPRQAAAPTSSPSPQPVSASTPWDAAAAGTEASALKRREDTLSGLGARWTLEQQEYGLEGPYADYKNNPYSKAALLQQNYDNARRGTTNSAGLQLYAGSSINAQNANTNHYGEGRNALEKAYAADFAQNRAERLEAENGYQEAIDNARWEAVQAALKAEPEAAPEAGGGTPATFSGYAPTGKQAGPFFGSKGPGGYGNTKPNDKGKKGKR